MSTVWTKDMVAAKISGSHSFMEQVILMVFLNGQTRYEKKIKDAVEKNRRGFTKAQATRGTWYALTIQNGGHLKGEDVEKAMRIAMLYCQQVAEIMNHNRRYTFLAKKTKAA